MRKLLCLFLAVLPAVVSRTQRADVPRLESSECIYKADGAVETHCGYLVVPENRLHPPGQIIKLTFISVESNNPAKKPDPVLYTGGGPGVSSLHPVTSIARRSLLRDRDYIAFEQRGTHYASPSLECNGSGQAVQEAYLNHRSIDEAVLETVRQCRKNLLQQGVDLSAYNTNESAAEIEDLRRLLGLDSVNLMGISYSGGLMMTVLQKYPQHIRSLILDSSLPEFVNIDEQELANFNEALTAVLDSSDDGLTARFRSYFSGLDGKVFTTNYRLKDSKVVTLDYGRSELLSILHDKVEDYDGIKELPQIVSDMIGGQQERYIMRISTVFFRGTAHYPECDYPSIVRTKWHSKTQLSFINRKSLCPGWQPFMSTTFTGISAKSGRFSPSMSQSKNRSTATSMHYLMRMASMMPADPYTTT